MTQKNAHLERVGDKIGKGTNSAPYLKLRMNQKFSSLCGNFQFISSLFPFVLQADLQFYLVWDLPAKIQGKGLRLTLESHDDQEGFRQAAQLPCHSDQTFDMF